MYLFSLSVGRANSTEIQAVYQFSLHRAWIFKKMHNNDKGVGSRNRQMRPNMHTFPIDGLVLAYREKIEDINMFFPFAVKGKYERRM